MTLIVIDGCEDTAWFGASGSIATGRNGNGWTVGAITQIIPAAQEADCITIGFALRTPSIPGGTQTFVSVRSDAAATQHDALQLNADGSLRVLRLLGTVISGPTAAGVIQANTWYYIEWAIRLHDTLGSSVVRVNGTTVLNMATGDTKNAGTKTVFDAIGWAVLSAGHMIDDLYLCTATTTPDAFLGDITVETLYPNGNGNANQFVGSDGDSVNNYLLVNEVGTPVTTSYTGSPTAGQQDLYTLSDLAASGGTILGVCHQAHAAKTDAGGAQLKIVNRRSADTKSPTLALATTYAPYHYTLAQDPETSAAWTIANVNALQSGVEVSDVVDVLFEPFNDFTTNSWALTSAPTIVAARTGTGASLVGASAIARYTIPSVNQSATVIVGFAYRINNTTGTRAMFRLESDSAATSHIYVDVLTDGTIRILLGGSAGSLLASSAPGVMPINTYVYLELQAVLHDTAGSVTMRANGTQVAAATNVDTKNAGTKTVFDTVCLLSPASGITNIFDDLYVTTGPGAPFKGSITL